MNKQVKSGRGTLALPPKVIDNLPDGRLTYKQFVEEKKFKVELTSIDDMSAEGGARVELHLFPKGETPIEFDSAYVVATRVRAEEPGGDWVFPVVFDVDIPDRVREVFHVDGDYTPYELAFIIYDIFENVDTSDTFAEILLDQTAPYQRQPGGPNGTGTRPALLIMGPEVPPIIDEAWLNDPANAGGINLTISTAYQKFEASLDILNLYISTKTTFSLMQGEGPAVGDFPLPATGIINLSIAFLRDLAEGVYFYSYNLKDAPGNISNNCAITNLFRRVKAPAPVLGLPRIPVTGPNGSIPISLVTLADPTKAIMEIDFPLHSRPGDRIVPHLTSEKAGAVIDLAEQSIPPAGTPGPLRFSMDYDTMLQLFGDPNGADEVEFEFWFELISSIINPNPTSDSVFARIDLAYAGPEQPNLPDLPNPNIAPVVVQGAGTPAPAPNVLGPGQANENATMSWPLWSDANRPITGRELVKFYYQGKQVGEPIQVRVGDTSVSTELPWGTILMEGNGTGTNARKAYITVEYPGSLNVMLQTPPTDVQVTAIVIDLPTPQIVVSAFTAATGLIPERIVNAINCPSLNHPQVVNGPMPPYQPRQLRIRVRRDINIPSAATVELTFVGRTTNTPTGADIPGTEITRSAQMPATGELEFWLTEYDRIREIQLPSPGTGQRPQTRYARIAYTVNGVTAEMTVPVALLNSSLVYCDEERPEAP